MGGVVKDAILHFLKGTTPKDALIAVADILLVYYAIYRVLLLIKGTRAAQMLIGLVLIGAGFFAAEQLELTTVSWLLDNFINYFIIIIIVVFQHDIRRGLVRIGQNLFSFGRTYEETHVFEEVIHAAEELAKSRIGALIVFEREGDLSEFVDTGRILDSRVTKELLVALFVPSRDNVLHDGAAIIRNLRVQQAGAVLPLSANAKLDKQFGTRHRAAIGITEETDAVVVVVSEERGAVSLCFNGNIARDLDAATLRKALLGLFQKKKSKSKGQPPSKGSRGGNRLVDITLGGVPVTVGGTGSGPTATPAEPGSSAAAGRVMPQELMLLLTTQPIMRSAKSSQSPDLPELPDPQNQPQPTNPPSSADQANPPDLTNPVNPASPPGPPRSPSSFKPASASTQRPPPDERTTQRFVVAVEATAESARATSVTPPTPSEPR